MTSVSVIGGAGFIGTRLCKNLASAGISFEIIDLKESRSFPTQSKVADIRSIAELRKALKGDIVVHLAAIHRDDIRDEGLYAETNIEGTRNVCLVAEEIGASKIIFTSSVAVYGFAQPGTDESGAINPFHEYGRTKFEAEEVLRKWNTTQPNSKLIIIRPTVVFGEGNRGNVYNLLRQIASQKFIMVGRGDNKKSMAYVGNVASFIEHAINTNVDYGLFNYVDGPDYDMRSLLRDVNTTLFGSLPRAHSIPFSLGLAIGYLADIVSKVTRRPLPISALRVRKFCATTSYASSKEKLGGFTAPFDLSEGLRRTLNAEFITPEATREVFYTE